MPLSGRKLPEDERSLQKLTGLLDKAKKYQNIIILGIALVALGVGLFIWKSSRDKKLMDDAWAQTAKANGIEDLKKYANSYGDTPAGPFLHYNLAMAYENDKKFDEARKEYELIRKEYSWHVTSEAALHRLAFLKTEAEWEKSGELKKRLDELKEGAVPVSGPTAPDKSVEPPTVDKPAPKAGDAVKVQIVADTEMPEVLIRTDKGDLTVRLFENDAPNTVANFISLCEGKFYDGLRFFIAGEEGVRAGSPQNDKDPEGGPGYTVVFEKTQQKHVSGALSMRRRFSKDDKKLPVAVEKETKSNLESAGSQFVICRKALPERDGLFAVFGEVTNGLDVLNKLAAGDRIYDVTVTKKRSHAYEPKKVQ
jgi:peptidyl-prolyl cis-trans isomerase B (cyclophilin B)